MKRFESMSSLFWVEISRSIQRYFYVCSCILNYYIILNFFCTSSKVFPKVKTNNPPHPKTFALRSATVFKQLSEKNPHSTPETKCSPRDSSPGAPPEQYSVRFRGDSRRQSASPLFIAIVATLGLARSVFAFPTLVVSP